MFLQTVGENLVRGVPDFFVTGVFETFPERSHPQKMGRSYGSNWCVASVPSIMVAMVGFYQNTHFSEVNRYLRSGTRQVANCVLFQNERIFDLRVVEESLKEPRGFTTLKPLWCCNLYQLLPKGEPLKQIMYFFEDFVTKFLSQPAWPTPKNTQKGNKQEYILLSF